MWEDDREHQAEDAADSPTVPEADDLRHRHDGFTPARRKAFLAALGKTGCVRDACKVAGISSTSAYRVRRRVAGFAEQWDSAQAMAASEIETLAWQRAVEGVEQPVYSYGKFSHMERKRSDGIFRMILMASNPEKYGRMGAASRSAAEMDKLKAKLKEQLREEIREEEYVGIEEVRERIIRKLGIVQQREIEEGTKVKLPNGMVCDSDQARELGYELVPTGDPQVPFRAEFRGPPLKTGRLDDGDAREGMAAGE